jgi:hypothetical protein
MKLLPAFQQSPISGASASEFRAGGNSVERRVYRKLSADYPPLTVHRAVQDAARIADAVGFRDLFLPILAEERVRKEVHSISTDQDLVPRPAIVSATTFQQTENL